MDRVVGIVMAGGAGRRMSDSGIGEPKPLVRVAGRPLLEWNLRALARAGVTRIHVVVRDDDVGARIADWVEATRSAVSDGADVRVTREPRPMGNIGGVRLAWPDAARAGLVVFADNITDLPLRDLLDHHDTAANDITVAVHREPFRIPYGVVDVADGLVTAYTEKPTIQVPVGSGTLALGPRSTALMDGPVGVVDLVTTALADGLRVGAWAHGRRWVDVNDAARIAAARDVVQAAPDAFGLTDVPRERDADGS